MTTASALQNYRPQQSALVSVDGRAYPLKSANINARAEGGIAATTLTQAYENPYAEALEVLTPYQATEMLTAAPSAPISRPGIGLKAMRLPKMPSLFRRPPGPILIENVRVLKLEDQILVVEFEVPVDGFMLPDAHTVVHVVLDDGGPDTAKILEQDSSKPGPYHAGLTIRLALRLEGSQGWNHDKTRIHWIGRINIENKMKSIGVEIRIQPGRD
jgi:hypothetical protein